MTDRYAYPQPHYAPGWRSPASPWDGVAIAALVTGVVGLGPVPIALGAVGVRRTRRTGRRGQVLAWVGLGLGVVSVVAWVGLAGLLWVLTRPLPADVAAPRYALATQVVEGTCLGTLPDDGEVWLVRVVPCTDEHGAEVVVHDDLADPPRTQRDLDMAAADLCRAQAASGGDLVVWAPRPGAATVTCLTTNQGT